MKHFSLVIAFLICTLCSFAQTKGFLGYDTTYFQRLGSNAEVVIYNATRDTVGFLFNKGGGRTEFKRILRKINNNTFLVGTDTLKITSTLRDAFLSGNEVGISDVMLSRSGNLSGNVGFSNGNPILSASNNNVIYSYVSVDTGKIVLGANTVLFPSLQSGVNRYLSIGQNGNLKINTFNTDSILEGANKFVSALQRSRIDTAYNWGNHALVGYIKNAVGSTGSLQFNRNSLFTATDSLKWVDSLFLIRNKVKIYTERGLQVVSPVAEGNSTPMLKLGMNDDFYVALGTKKPADTAVGPDVQGFYISTWPGYEGGQQLFERFSVESNGDVIIHASPLQGGPSWQHSGRLIVKSLGGHSDSQFVTVDANGLFGKSALTTDNITVGTNQFVTAGDKTNWNGKFNASGHTATLIPYAGSNGSLKTSTYLSYNDSSLLVVGGTTNATERAGISFNAHRASIRASAEGMFYRLGSLFAGQTSPDASKSHHFMNYNRYYLSLSQLTGTDTSNNLAYFYKNTIVQIDTLKSGDSTIVMALSNGRLISVSKSTFLRNNTSATYTGTWQGNPISDAYISSASIWNNKQNALNGTGLVRMSGTSVTYDNATYLTSLLHKHRVYNSAGTQQFEYDVNEGVRYEGTGSTTVSFDSANKKVVINSAAGGATPNSLTASNGTVSLAGAGMSTLNATITNLPGSAINPADVQDFNTLIDNRPTAGNNSKVPSSNGAKVYTDSISAVKATEAVEINKSRNKLRMYQLLGSNLKAETFNVSFNETTTSNGLTSGQARFVLVYVDSAFTATGIKYYLGQATTYTGSAVENQISLHSVDVGTGNVTRVATSTNDIAHFTGATGVRTASFTSSVYLPVGFYYICYYHNVAGQTTTPNLSAASSNTGNAIASGDFANGVKLNAQYTVGSTPTSVQASSLGQSTLRIWGGIY